MTKLNQLIANLCPGGVPYKTLGEIATDMYRGSGIKRDEVTKEGIPCVRYGEIYTTYNIWFDSCVSHTQTGHKYFGHGDILFAITGESVEEIAKSCAYMGNETCLAGGDIVIMKHDQNPKYLAYALSTTNAQEQKSKGRVKSKVVHSNVPVLKSITIPVPPLEIQAEIVRILDKFSALTAELTAELALRKKQYAYYRDALLALPDAPRVALGEVFTMRNGYTPSKSKPEYWENGTIPWFRMDDIRQNGHILSDSLQHITPQAVKGKLFPANSIIMATTATIGEHALLIADSLANQQFTYFTKNVNCLKKYGLELDMKFAYYYFFIIDEWCKKNTNISSFPSVDMGKLKNLEFPVPPLERQAEIVAISDKFEALTTSLTQGLPAEIAARQKQYAYYRDKLLSFQVKK